MQKLMLKSDAKIYSKNGPGMSLVGGFGCPGKIGTVSAPSRHRLEIPGIPGLDWPVLLEKQETSAVSRQPSAVSRQPSTVSGSSSSGQHRQWKRLLCLEHSTSCPKGHGGG